MKTILPLQLLVQPDLQDPEPLVIYHGRNCPDGFAAALAAKLLYGDAAQYLGLDHGDVKTLDDLPPTAGRSWIFRLRPTSCAVSRPKPPNWCCWTTTKVLPKN